MLRSILAVVLGVVVSTALIAAIDAVNHAIYPPPEAITAAAKSGNFEATRQAISDWLPRAPTAALVLLPVSWIAGTFVGSLTAAWIARRRPLIHALIVGLFPLLGTIANLLMFPHPGWIATAGLAGVPLAAIAAGLLAPRRLTCARRMWRADDSQGLTNVEADRILDALASRR